jgi:hypothetical protein
MFPNVRMMIAATLASIVALSFIFGVMATFFVSHEPRGLMTSHARPLQLGVDTAAPAIGETFGSRFQLNVTQTDHAALHDPVEDVDTPGPVAMATPDGDAEDGDIVSSVAPATEAPAVEAPAAVAATASDPDTTEPATASSIDPSREAGPAGEALAGAEAEPPLPPSMPEPGQVAKNDEPDEHAEDAKVAAVVAGEPAPVTTTAAAEEADDAPPSEDNAHQPETVPKAAEKPAARKAKHKAAAKAESRQHVAAKTHRFRRVRPATEATNQAYYQQFAQPNFQTAPLEQQTIRSRVVRSGIGGPFVSPPSH